MGELSETERDAIKDGIKALATRGTTASDFIKRQAEEGEILLEDVDAAARLLEGVAAGN